MPARPSALAARRQILAFVLAGILALTVVLLSGWGGDTTEEGAAGKEPTAPSGTSTVEP